jgi:ribosomal protein S18 acetylase RimI-like enzyme
VRLFRRVERRDREAVLALLTGTEAFQPHELVVAMELVDVSLQKPEQDDYHPWVLEVDGALVAYACFGKNPMARFAFDLYWLATRRDSLRQGFGRAMVAFVEQRVRSCGGRLLVIETSSKETYQGSREFYTRIGCELGGRIPDFYDENDDRVIYFKRLLGPAA